MTGTTDCTEMKRLVPQPPVEVDSASADDPETTTEVMRRRTQRGMVSAEWAVGLIAAVAIAGVLFAVVTTGSVKSAILNFVLLVIRSFSDNI